MSLDDDDIEERLARLRDATESIRPSAGFADRVAQAVDAEHVGRAVDAEPAGRVVTADWGAAVRRPRAWGRAVAWTALAAAVLLGVGYARRPRGPEVSTGAGPTRQLEPPVDSASTPASVTAPARADLDAGDLRAAPPRTRPDAGRRLDARQELEAISPASDGGVEVAKEHYTNALRLYDEGNYQAAAVEFDRAYAAAPNYRIFYNTGLVRKQLGDNARAAEDFERYLREGGSSVPEQRRRQLELEIANLRRAAPP